MSDPIRLYLDEDSSAQRFARALRAASLDVLTAPEAGMLGVSDADQLTFAASVRRTIVSANQRDYVRLHGEWLRAGRAHAGVIIRTRQGARPELQARRLADLVRDWSAADAVNTLSFLGADRRP